ncbi:hypothetical protein ACFLYI_01590 [Chloroflexota bacterium]
MAAKRHMDIKRNITRHNISKADITEDFLKKLCLRCQGGCDLPPVVVFSKIELPAQDLAVLSQEPVVGIRECYADGVDYIVTSQIKASLFSSAFPASPSELLALN